MANMWTLCLKKLIANVISKWEVNTRTYGEKR